MSKAHLGLSGFSIKPQDKPDPLGLGKAEKREKARSISRLTAKKTRGTGRRHWQARVHGQEKAQGENLWSCEEDGLRGATRGHRCVQACGEGHTAVTKEDTI